MDGFARLECRRETSLIRVDWFRVGDTHICVDVTEHGELTCFKIQSNCATVVEHWYYHSTLSNEKVYDIYIYGYERPPRLLAVFRYLYCTRYVDTKYDISIYDIIYIYHMNTWHGARV